MHFFSGERLTIFNNVSKTIASAWKRLALPFAAQRGNLASLSSYSQSSYPSRYFLSLLIVAFALCVQAAFYPWLGTHTPFLLMLPAVFLTATLLGYAPGLLALLIGTIDSVALFSVAQHAPMPAPSDRPAIYAFFGVGLLLTWLGNRFWLLTQHAAEAEVQLHLTQENSNVGLFDIDLGKRTIFPSTTLYRLVGRTPDERARRSPITLNEWHAAFRDEEIKESARIFRQHAKLGVNSYETEHDVTLPNGKVRCLLSQVHIERNDHGEPVRLRGASVDITERKHMGAQLHQTRSELTQQVADLERLHELSSRVLELDDLPSQLQTILKTLALFHRCDKGLVSLWDPIARHLVVETQIGFSDAGIQMLSQVPEGAGACGIAYAEKRRMIVEDTELDPCFDAYRPCARKEGFRAIHCIPLISMQGEVMGVIAVHLDKPHRPDAREIRLADICARKAAIFIERTRAKTQAHISDQRFQIALDASAVPFSIFTPVRNAAGTIVDFRWTYVNRAVTQILRRPQHELIGSGAGELFPGFWERNNLFEHYVAVAEHGKTREFELNSPRSAESWFHIVASPLQGAVAVWSADITERKRQEKALQDADRRKDEFLATLAHELRNPLAPIRQAAMISKMPEASDAQKRWSHEVIERQLRHMALLLDDLLDVSRITRGTLQLRKCRTDLGTVIDAALETAKPLIDARKHQLQVELPPTPLYFDGDQLRISQVLANLLMNAAKYTDPGGTIRLSAERFLDQVMIRVEDNGIGIKPETLTEIFQMFTQVRSTQDRSNGGLGIGLALAKGLIELHGGKITAHSRGLGHGSAFVVSLPLGATMEIIPTMKPTTSEAIAPRKILIADDNQDAADSLALLLRLDGHDVHVVFDGAAALAEFSDYQPDLMLLDIGMPKMSGMEVAQAIRRLPTGQDTMLVAITGWGQERDKHQSLSAGFDVHLTKPIDPEYLRTLLLRQPFAPATSLPLQANS